MPFCGDWGYADGGRPVGGRLCRRAVQDGRSGLPARCAAGGGKKGVQALCNLTQVVQQQGGIRYAWGASSPPLSPSATSLGEEGAELCASCAAALPYHVEITTPAAVLLRRQAYLGGVRRPDCRVLEDTFDAYNL